MLCWTGNVLLVAKRQQTPLPAPVSGYLMKYFTSLKSRAEDPLGNLATGLGSLVPGGLLGYGYRVLHSECRARCVTTSEVSPNNICAGESCTEYKTASALHRGKLQFDMNATVCSDAPLGIWVRVWNSFTAGVTALGYGNELTLSFGSAMVRWGSPPHPTGKGPRHWDTA